MTIEEALFTHLTTNAGVSALVGAKVYPLVVPQNVTLPAISYQVVSAQRVHTMQRDPGVSSPRVQLTCWGTSYASAKGLARAVQAALQDFSGVMGGGVTVLRVVGPDDETDLYDDQTKSYGVALDFLVWHVE